MSQQLYEAYIAQVGLDVPLSVAFQRFAKTCLKIRTLSKRGRWEYVPFVVNAEQLVVLKCIERDLTAGRGSRIIVCKGRKLGISTLAQGLAFYWGTVSPGWSSTTMAHIIDATREIAQISQNFRLNVPAPLVPYIQPKSFRGELLWANGSKLRVMTQGSDGGSRGSSPSFLHLSEVGSWHKKRADTTGNEPLVAALGALEANASEEAAPGTVVIIESTANGATGPFFERWYMAQTSRTWTPLFFAWQEATKYQPPLNESDVSFLEELAGVAGDKRQDLWRQEILGWLSTQRRSSEADAIEWAQRAIEYRLTPSQVRWALGKTEELGSLDKFDEEFPLSADHAFLASGRPVLKPSDLAHIVQPDVPMPLRCGRIGKLYDEKVGAEALCKAAALVPGDAWIFWEMPEPGWRDRYIAAADVSSGAEEDFASIQVLDRVTLRIVAEFHNDSTNPSDLAVELDTIGMLYHRACVAPEVNNHGHVVVRALFESGYPNLYRRQVADRGERLVRADEWSNQFGWDTTPTTRTVMLDEVVRIVRQKEVVLRSQRLRNELSKLVFDKKKRIDHRKGEHDDLVVALAIAVQVHHQLPPPQSDKEIERAIFARRGRSERTNKWLGARAGRSR